MRETKPKLSTSQPAVRDLDDQTIEEIDREARECRRAIEEKTTRMEAIDADDLRVCVR